VDLGLANAYVAAVLSSQPNSYRTGANVDADGGPNVV
jgi:hypothetical protein